MGRSSAYWTSNLYLSELEEPVPTAPLNDLPPSLASRFRALRDGLLQIAGVDPAGRLLLERGYVTAGCQGQADHAGQRRAQPH